MYVIKYKGNFGFIKPFNAVRDIKTITQKFLTESSIEGISRFLECKGKIIRHKISYDSINEQQECIESKGFVKKNKKPVKERSIYIRGVMVNPILHLGFDNSEDAENAFNNFILLSRREDLMFPESICEMSEEEFDAIPGIESFPSTKEDGHFVGGNKYTNEKMYAKIKVVDPQ